MAAIVELRDLSDEELKDMLEAGREELFNLRFQKASGALENTARLGLVRREIAQLNEVLHKRELAVKKAAEHAEISAVIAKQDWKGSAKYIYEDGAWEVTIVDDGDNEIATAMVDLNSKRRKTRRDRNRKPKVRILSYTIAG